MAKLVHSDPACPIRSIDNQGREYNANDQGEFNVEDDRADFVKSKFGLIDKEDAKKGARSVKASAEDGNAT